MNRRIAISVVVVVLLALAAWLMSRREAPPPRASAANPSAQAAPAAEPDRAEPRQARSGAIEAPFAHAVRDAERGPAGGSIEGRVLSAATGKPIENAELTFQRDDGATSVRSGPGGAYSFAPGRAGRYRLAAASADGFLPFAPAWGRSPLAVTLADGQRVRGVDVKLVPAIEYTVHVTDAANKPLAGADVRVLGGDEGEFALLPLPSSTRTDAGGDAKVRAPDHASIEAAKPGYAASTAGVDTAAMITRRLAISLRPLAQPEGTLAISGRVLDEQGAPIEAASVAAFSQREVNGTTVFDGRTARSRADGSFAVEGLRAGKWQLHARAEGYRPAQADDVQAGSAGVTLQLSAATGRIAGRVTDAHTGAPVVSFVVAVRRPRGPLRLDTELSRSFVDPDGRYELSGVMPGEARVVIASAGYAPSSDISITIPASGQATADAALRAGSSLRGAVLDKKTRQPIEGARVMVEGWRSEASAPVLRIDTTTDAAGQFALTGLAEGAVSFTVSADKHNARIVAAQGLPREGEGPLQTIYLTPIDDGQEPQVELTGIGAVLQADGEALLIRQVIAGGGALEAGLQAGDKVVRIEGASVVGIGFEGAMALIRGPEGSSVLLTVQRGDRAPADVRVFRRLIRG